MSVPIFRPRTPIRLLLAALCCGTALGCAAVQHGLDASDYAGEALSPHSARGAERLRAEMTIDSSVAAHVAAHGRPDYLYVVDRRTLYFFYVETDRATKFDRVLVEASEVEELGRIPGRLLKLLPEKARSHVEARRAAEQRRAQAKARQGRTRQKQAQRAPTPSAAASLSPDGAYLAAFEAAEIVGRMREPGTAADPGVSDWRRARLREGGVAWSAQAGRTHYEVSSDRVAFTTPISASRGQLPGAARIAIARINNAIFASKASTVNALAMDLARRAAADRTGRTRFSKRVAGRTLRIGRIAGRGVFAYSVHP